MRVYFRNLSKFKYVFLDLDLINPVVDYMINKIVNLGNSNQFNDFAISNIKNIFPICKISKIDISSNCYFIGEKCLSLDSMCSGEKYVFLSSLLSFIDNEYCIANIHNILSYDNIDKFIDTFRNCNLNLFFTDTKYLTFNKYTEGMQKYGSYYSW